MSAAEKISAVEFARPEPAPLMPDRGTQQPFPTGYLEDTMRLAVEGISKLAFVPHSLAAQSILSACSLAVQPHFNVLLPTGQIRPLSLFMVSVAESGDRKSTSDQYAMQAVSNFETDLRADFLDRKADALIQQAAWDEAKKQATQTHKKNGRHALEEAYRALGPRPEGPVEPGIVIRKGTTQGLLKRFLHGRPSLGLMSDEGGSWLGGYGFTDDNRLETIATLSDFWDGTPVHILTAGEGHSVLEGKRLTFHLMIQPSIAGRLLGNAEAQGQGFLSRLLVSHPESLAGTRLVDPDAGRDPAALQAVAEFEERLGQIVRAAMPMDIDTHVLSPETLKLDPRATKLWWSFYNSIERELGPDGKYQSVKGFVGKLSEMAARIAGNLTVFAEGIRADTIGEQQMLKGIKLAEFYLSEALRLFGKAAMPQHIENAQLLSDWLAEKWTEPFISATDASRLGPTALRSRTDDIKEALEVLARHDHVVLMPNGAEVKGKKRQVAWRVIVGRD
ncbi:YfjI family protein [Qipengyuania pacifica]|uniref:YfjI family protein n=1 Tax=Qipengyuania pacifica TaxID=2860199 RepID=UPI001C9D7D2C|nr:YfjI family protein [Qipengyuania pacifica]MBY8335189.1 DUF3987 domain-containing protein [Qipengyuania pacifica]